MNASSRRLLATAAPLLGILVAGCSDPGTTAGSDGHSHSGHGHRPKNGGQLVEVGRHQYNLEVLADTTAGRVTVWVLDAHAEGYVRMPDSSLNLTLSAGGETHPAVLHAVASAASGETLGDTSQFEGAVPWVTSHPEFAGRFDSLTIRGQTFTNLTFRHPASGSGHAH